ncbi:hypothetical protein PLICRDRAFT_692981 [Plicaturopsis crispa FD-325 SS-3]|nr:hypothetical protein PLICRDRAFT_692981 [Plicaturopsis crispa FD-325 SS-3]
MPVDSSLPGPTQSLSSRVTPRKHSLPRLLPTLPSTVDGSYSAGSPFLQQQGSTSTLQPSHSLLNRIDPSPRTDTPQSTMADVDAFLSGMEHMLKGATETDVHTSEQRDDHPTQPLDDASTSPQADAAGSPSSEAAVNELLTSMQSETPQNLDTTNDPPPSWRHSPLSTSPAKFAECRRILLPVIARNAHMHASDTSAGGAHSERLLHSLDASITDEECFKFIQLSKRVKEQMAALTERKANAEARGVKRGRDDAFEEARQALRKETRFGSPYGSDRRDSEATLVEETRPIPSAPKAMRTNPSIRALEDFLTKTQKRPTETAHASGVGRPRGDHDIPQSPHPSNISSRASMDRASLDVRSPPPPYTPHAEIQPIPMPEMSKNAEEQAPDVPESAAANEDVEMNAGDTEQLLPQENAISTRPVLPVPGLWFAKVGQLNPQILEASFTVTDELSPTVAPILRNTLTPNQFPYPSWLPPPDSIASPSLYLVCADTGLVSRTTNVLKDGAPPSAQALAGAVWNARSTWPTQGSLVVQINGKETIIPKVNAGPIDVTAHVNPGDNVFRFMQLTNQSDRVYVLYTIHGSQSLPTTPSVTLPVQNSTPSPATSKKVPASADDWLARIQEGLSARSCASRVHFLNFPAVRVSVEIA